MTGCKPGESPKEPPPAGVAAPSRRVQHRAPAPPGVGAPTALALQLARKRGRTVKKRLLESREEDVQKVIVDGLRLLGYTVLVTTHRVRRCQCGRWGRGDYGATKGVPDLLVRRKNWNDGVYVGLEVKGPKTPLSREQKALLAEGGLVVVRSLEDALEVLGDMP